MIDFHFAVTVVVAQGMQAWQQASGTRLASLVYSLLSFANLANPNY